MAEGGDSAARTSVGGAEKKLVRLTVQKRGSFLTRSSTSSVVSPVARRSSVKKFVSIAQEYVYIPVGHRVRQKSDLNPFNYVNTIA